MAQFTTDLPFSKKCGLSARKLHCAFPHNMASRLAATNVPEDANPTSEKSVTDETLVRHEPEQLKSHVTGFKLALLLGSLTLVTFVVLLDTSIIGTVSTTPAK